MSAAEYEFDVAFSFHSKDEGLATELNDLLQDRFKTFLYSKRQEMLAGSDGEAKFNAVFGQKARCVVVFCRKEWGHTPFTRIEETAIRNRAFEEGYEFTVFIPTDEPPTIPPWLPRTRLYFGLKRFGLQGAAGVLEARVQELGGDPDVESIGARAARFQRAQELQRAQKSFTNSLEGANAARSAYSVLAAALEAKVAEARATGLRLEVKTHQEYRLIVGLGIWTVACWRSVYQNSLDDSVLTVDICDGMPRLPGFMVFEESHRIQELAFDYALLTIGRHGYIERTGKKRSFAPDELADHLLRTHIDLASRAGDFRRL